MKTNDSTKGFSSESLVKSSTCCLLNNNPKFWPDLNLIPIKYSNVSNYYKDQDSNEADLKKAKSLTTNNEEINKEILSVEVLNKKNTIDSLNTLRKDFQSVDKILSGKNIQLNSKLRFNNKFLSGDCKEKEIDEAYSNEHSNENSIDKYSLMSQAITQMHDDKLKSRKSSVSKHWKKIKSVIKIVNSIGKIEAKNIEQVDDIDIEIKNFKEKHKMNQNQHNESNDHKA